MDDGRPAKRTDAPLARFVDTHCHLDDDSFDDDLIDVLDRSRRAGVTRWINVGFNPDRWPTTIGLSRNHPGLAFMLGIHPGDVAEWNDSVGQRLETLARAAGAVAIGEIGLDFYRGETNVNEQVTAFNAQLDLAVELALPAVIHMRAAEPELLAVLAARFQSPRLVFHSFDGSGALTDWIIDHDGLAGVGGLATRSASQRIWSQLERLTLDRIVLETDSPYLVPNGFKHRRNTPESIPTVASFLADLFGTTIDEVARQTTSNATRFFDRLGPT